MLGLYYPFVFAFPLSCIWFISPLAETSPPPFEFSEDEPWWLIVSEFNISDAGGDFALIFLAEYTTILIMTL